MTKLHGNAYKGKIQIVCETLFVYCSILFLRWKKIMIMFWWTTQRTYITDILYFSTHSSYV